jgi:hypothetical protein
VVGVFWFWISVIKSWSGFVPAAMVMPVQNASIVFVVSIPTTPGVHSWPQT